MSRDAYDRDIWERSERSIKGSVVVNNSSLNNFYFPHIEKQKKMDSLYMDIAERVSNMSHCNRSKVGCVIVTPDNITSYGWNGMPSGMDNCCEDESNTTKKEVLHAELNALSKINSSTVSTKDATLYVTLSPCIECAKQIMQSGISNVVYRDDYRDTSGIDLLSKNSKIKVRKYEAVK